MLRLTEIGPIGSTTASSFSCGKIIPWILLFMGCSILAFWIIEIIKNRKFLKENSFRWKNENNDIMWFHVAAELITAILLVIAGTTIWLGKSCALSLVLFSAGLLFYASLNSLSWVFAEKSRIELAIPMVAGIVVSGIVLICCLV